MRDTYLAGDVIRIDLTFAETVTVDTSGGTPYLELVIGGVTRQATYDAALSSGAEVVFTYTVQAADLDLDGFSAAADAVKLNGGTIRNGAGDDVALTITGGIANTNKVAGTPQAEPRNVPTDWPLLPSGIEEGDKFRLLFVTSQRRNAQEAAISAYDQHVQNSANGGLEAIRPFSDRFRAVGCTQAVPATVNTGTLTADSSGVDTDVPIYWLDGDKVADDYEDFYDGDWDSRAIRLESGATSHVVNTAWTGCNGDGTPANNRSLGIGANSLVRAAFLASGNPLDGQTSLFSDVVLPLYALSPVLTVVTPFCGRTPQVRDAILAAHNGVSGNIMRSCDSTDLSDDSNAPTEEELAAVTSLDLSGDGLTSLKEYDFAGLTGLTSLDLSGNPGLTRMPAGILDPVLPSLTSLALDDRLKMVLSWEDTNPTIYATGAGVVDLAVIRPQAWAAITFDTNWDDFGTYNVVNDREMAAGARNAVGMMAATPSDTLDGHEYTLHDLKLTLTSNAAVTAAAVAAHSTDATMTLTVVDPPGDPVAQEVPTGTPAVPAGLLEGDTYRLLFVTSTSSEDPGHDARSPDIADYNTFVQERAANGLAVIAGFAGEWRAVGCTQQFDATANTGTGSGTGEPIYWLNGAKVADNYMDFYDGSWDSTDGRDESGAASNPAKVWTGCKDNGTTDGQRLGRVTGTHVRFGDLTMGSPLSRGSSGEHQSFPFYALSPVLTAAAPLGPQAGVTNPPDMRDTYLAGDVIRIDLTFAETVTVDTSGGTPYLELQIGGVTRQATYDASLSGGAVVVFTYTVQADDLDADGFSAAADAVKLNGGTIRNGAGDDVALTLAGGIANTANKVAGTPQAEPRTVPSNWPLVPTGIDEGEKFRLLFVTAANRDATSTDIADYNSHAQESAARVADPDSLFPAAHAAIRGFSGQFRAVACTQAVPATVNTGTLTADSSGIDKNVPIHWLDGAKVADDYDDFYDGGWDSNSGRTESGAERTPVVWTGCNSDGTSHSTLYLGTGTPRAGSLGPGASPLSDSSGTGNLNSRPLYALSPVLTRSDKVDYDADDDGLIEIVNADQLHAVRWDLDGDGTPGVIRVSDYAARFPNAMAGMGCPASGCIGYELMADIDLSTELSFVPIGNNASPWNPYDAVLEGNGRTVSGLTLNRPASNRVGLFATVGAAAEVRNLALTAVDVTGNINVGALAGVNDGTITGVTANGSVTADTGSGTTSRVGGLVGTQGSGGAIRGSGSTVSVTSNQSLVGGLAGQNEGEISRSYASGAVSTSHTGGDALAGGLAGFNTSGASIAQSYASGAVTSGGSLLGGLAGRNHGEIIAAYATGQVRRTGSGGGWIGGLVGHNNHANAHIRQSYATGAVVGGTQAVGGLVGSDGGLGRTTRSYWNTETSGRTASGGGTGKTGRELRAPTRYSGLYADWDSPVTDLPDDRWDFGANYNYPALKGVGGKQRGTAPPGDLATEDIGDPATGARVTWSAPADTGDATLAGYEYRTSTDGTFSGAWTSTTGTTFDVTFGDPPERAVQVRAVSTGAAHTRSLAVRESLGGLVFTSPSAFTLRENVATAVGRVMAEDRDGRRIDRCRRSDAYTLGGADARRFVVNCFGDLSFRAAPDYENPRDAGRNNVYDIVVTVKHGSGSDEETGTQAVTVTVTNIDPPSAPRNPGFDDVTRVSLELEWSPPAATGGQRVDRYEMRHRRAGTSGWTHGTKQVPRYQDSRTRHSSYLTGLEANTRYEAQVRAGNSEGGGPWSARVSATTAGSPAAPSPTIGDVGETSVEVRWTAPDDGGSAIEEYALAHGLDGGGLFTLRSLGADARSSTVGGLERDTRYQFKMRARNANGWGPWSALVKATTGGGDDPEEPGAGSPISGFTLARAGGGDLRTIADGDTVAEGLGRVEIRADLRAGATIGSVRLALSGPVSASRTENWAPYELYGGQGGPELAAGSYTLKATPYEKSNLRGERRPALTVSFTVGDGDDEDPEDGSPVAGFTLVGASGDLRGIADGDTVATGLGRTDIRADIRAGESVGSVRLVLNGPVSASRTENIAPYELYGGNRGPELTAGSYTLKATPYPRAHLGGEALPARTVSFTVGAQANAVVDGAVLTLTFSSPRDAFAPPDGPDFAVRADGAPRAVTGAALAGSRAVLTLEAPVAPGQAVLVDYLGAAMHPLADADGARTPPWTDLAALNVTAPEAVFEGLAPAARALAAAVAVEPAAPPADAERYAPDSLSLSGLGLADADLALLDLGGARRLDLSGNALTDLSALAGLAGLESLDLSGNAVADLWPLAGLVELRRLDLSGNRVADLAPLAGLPRLEVLVLAGNAVTDIGALTHHMALGQLDLSGNAVADLAPLADLGALRRLDLGGNPAADLSPVGDLGTLVWLRLPGAADAAPVERLVRLRWLWRGTAGACLACAPDADDR